MKSIFHIGRYFMLLGQVFNRPERVGIYWRQTIHEVVNLGISSLGIVLIMSTFMGAVVTLQTASMIDSPLIPLYTVGFTTRQTVILEFSPTVICFVLAGKVGSNIAGEIGSMRVTEQIDALDIMGVNSAAYLIQPKVIASVFIFPFLIAFSMFTGVMGGWLVSVLTGIVTSYEFHYGVLYDFDSFTVTYALIKTVVFAFIITTVSAYYGYYTRGGALEVGRSSTKAVVYSIIMILVFNLALTQILLI